METKEIEKHKKELLQIGRKVNDFGATFALHSHNKKEPLQDICQVTEDIFEISFRAGIMYVLSHAVIDGCLSTVNGKHGVHIPDELYEELSARAKG